MNYTVKTSDLKKYIKLLSGVSGNSGYVILSGKNVEAIGDGVKIVIKVSDLDGMPYVVMAKPLLETVNRIKTEELEVVLEDCVVVKSGRSRSKLATYDMSSVPNVGDVGSEAQTVDLSSAAFITLIERVSYAVCEDESRQYINGVFLHTEDGRLVAVATDGHRLAKYSIKCLDRLSIEGITIPNEAVKQIKKFLALRKADHQIKLFVGDGRIKIVTDYGSILCTLLDSQFIEYKSVIPETVNTIDTDHIKMSEAIERLLIVSGHEKKINLRVDGTELVLTARDGDFHGEERLEYEGVAAFSELAFNGKYIMEALRCYVMIDFDHNRPIVMRGFVDNGYTAVVMPMRV